MTTKYDRWGNTDLPYSTKRAMRAVVDDWAGSPDGSEMTRALVDIPTGEVRAMWPYRPPRPPDHDYTYGRSDPRLRPVIIGDRVDPSPAPSRSGSTRS